MKNSLRGHRAKSAGDTFEEIFQVICNRDGIICVDFPDGCTKVKTPYGLKLYPKNMPFDFMICRDGKSAAIDAKTVQGKTFEYSMITRHQLESLSEVGPHIPSGYVVWFREIDKVVFFDYLKLISVASRTSLKPEDGIMLGTIGNARLVKVLTHETKPTYQPSLI